MSVTQLHTLKSFVQAMLDVDVEVETIMTVAMKAYGCSRARFGKVWNEALCMRHGI